jgi:hypothetical protein
VARLAAAPLAPHAPHLAGEPLAVAGPPYLEPLRSQRVRFQLGVLLDLDLVRLRLRVRARVRVRARARVRARVKVTVRDAPGEG